MKKIQKSIIALCAAAVIAAGAAGAAVWAQQNTAQTAKNETFDVGSLVSGTAEAETSQRVSSAIVDTDLRTLLANQGYLAEETSEVMERYAALMATYDLSADDTQTIYQMVQSGKNLEMIMDLVEFLQDTQEQNTILEDVYNAGAAIGFGYRHWMEEAYNRVTQNVHGVLDAAGISSYLAQGLTTDDILCANLLSRVSSKTISSILDDLSAGQSWAQIFAGIYPSLEINVSELGSETNGKIIFRCIKAAQITGLDVNTLYTEHRDDLNGLVADFVAAKTQSVPALLLANSQASQDALSQEGAMTVNDVYNAAREKGFLGQDVAYLKDRGLKYSDVLTVMDLANTMDISLEDALYAFYEGGDAA